MSGLLAEELLTQELESVKSNIERIISSYRHTWDIYTELLQNSGDAIFEKFGSLADGKIELKINTVTREITIKDNGVGISASDIHKILVIGKSLKRDSGNGKFGFMGFGFTFIAFQSCFLKIESIKDGVKACRTYENLYKFIFDNEDLPQSLEEINQDNPPVDTDAESGTTITITMPQEFPIEEVEQSIFSAFKMPKCSKALEIMLRTKTIVGSLDHIFNRGELFRFDVEVDGKEVEIKTGHLLTREVVERALGNSVLFYDKDTYQNFILATESLPDAQKLLSRRCNFLDHKVLGVDIGTRNPLKADFYIAATSKSNISSFMDDAVDDSIKIEHGLWLSICGMPIGICLDRFEHASMLPYTVLVDINSPDLRKDLDAGRKGLSDYRQKQISKVAWDLLQEHDFRKYKQYIAGGFDSRVQDPTYDPKKELINKVAVKQKYDVDLVSPYFPLAEEQEVISLFIDLLSKNFIKGYKIKALSGFQVYDAILDYHLKKTDSALYSPSNIFGVGDKIFSHAANTLAKDNVLVEFKQDINGLFKDIDKNKKDISQIEILVCWDVRFKDKEKYLNERGDVLRLKDSALNMYHGVTHELVVAGRTQPLPIMELNTILKQLFDLDL